MRKVLAVLLSIITVGCLVGCRNDAQKPDGTSSAPESGYTAADDGASATTDGDAEDGEDVSAFT